mgnify:FL=1
MAIYLRIVNQFSALLLIALLDDLSPKAVN